MILIKYGCKGKVYMIEEGSWKMQKQNSAFQEDRCGAQGGDAAPSSR